MTTTAAAGHHLADAHEEAPALLPPAPKPGSAALSPRDHEVLSAGGLHFPDDDEALDAATSQTITACETLLSSSTTVAALAARLGREPFAVRQMIAERALYGVRVRNDEYLLPTFQFGDDGRPLHGLKEVLAAIPREMNVLTVEGFFTTPDPDLPDEQGNSSTPARWLASGGDPRTVAELASSL